MAEFEKNNPDFAAYFSNPEAMNNLQIPNVYEKAPIYDCWEKAAKRLVSCLWRHNSCWIFHEPVDPEKLQIKDYFEIVQKPMDLGTIKHRLNTSYYNECREFIDDIEHMF